MTPWATASGRLPKLQWAAAFRPLSGESVSGDHHLVAPFEGGILMAVVDALGHGAEAEYAARLAVAALSSRRDATIDELLKECHRSLSKTRGVAAALASFNFKRATMSWIAIGNVEGILVRSSSKGRRHSIIQHGGIVGYQMPRIPPIENLKLEEGDRICFATDGIKSGFAETLNLSDPLPDLAARVLEKFEDVRDDALVLLAEHGGV
jgi:negative regulator of sigma-B (phosphoserine phosphatase)